MSEAGRSGLVSGQGNTIPLKGVRIDAKVSGPCSQVKVTQRYRNEEAVDVEAVYVFPLEEGGAVCGFSARVGDRVIEGRVEEREKAFETYDDAMAEGHGAFLLEQERPNIFTASVGNIKPGQSVEISVTYVALLQRDDEAIRLMIPTTVSPRYVPTGPPEVGEPDSDRINPEKWLAVPYGLTLSVEIDGTERIVELESPSHTVRTRFTEGGAVVELSSESASLDRDFVLLIKTAEAHKPVTRVAREADGTRVAMVTFFPNTDELPRSKKEVIFLVDCSGSMGGPSIEEARRALALCVRALDEGDSFNIVRFGSGFDSMWSEPKAFGQATLDEASGWIQQRIQADLGGTEILEPLQHLTQGANAQGARQILLLTDGQVSNEDQVIALCQAHAGRVRVFSFGIGAGASEHLVRGVARASRGAAEFIFPGERIEPKVLRQFRRVSTPTLTDVRVDWGGLSVEQAPLKTPPVFSGDSLTVFARIKSGEAGQVTLKAGELSWTTPIDPERAEVEGPIPTLWARAAIRDLEDGKPRRGSNQSRGRDRTDQTRDKIVELGVRYKLMSSATSYVAIEERADSDKSQGQAQLRRVPVALTTGWGGTGAAVSAGGMGAAQPMSKARRSTASTGSMSPMAPPSMSPAPMMPAPMMPPSPAPPPGGMPPRPVPMAASAPSFRMDSPAPPPPSAIPMGSGSPQPPQSRAMPMGSGGLPPEPPSQSESLFRRAKDKAAAIFKKADSAPGDRAMSPSRMEREQSRADTGSDRLFDLLMTQRADGSFGLSEALRSWVGSRWSEIQARAQQKGEPLVATALVLLVLERHAAGREDEWGMAADKARRWLSSQGGKVDVSDLV